jgi:D-alanyl-lipoteichoic acid acyltransferase DltB (MBOAT superfamily)
MAVGIFLISYIDDSLLKPFVAANFNDFFMQPHNFNPAGVAIFCILSLLILYFNFAGYIDIAIGSGNLFGLRLSENFLYPFAATNIQVFWKRWHVTLGGFANRYMFFPLMKLTGGRIEVSLVVTFLLIGLWHGLSWNFMIWGLAHGVALAFYAGTARWRKSSVSWNALRSHRFGVVLLLSIVSWAVTMLFVSWAWTFAIAPDVKAGLLMTRSLLGLP